MSEINNRGIFNKMLQTALQEFTAHGEDKEFELPVPTVHISTGVQFLINYFNAKDVVSTIGYALLREDVKDENLEDVFNLVWFYEVDKDIPFGLGTVSAYSPENADVYEYYNDGFSSKKEPFFSENITTRMNFQDIDKLVLLSNFISDKGYYIYLPNEAPAPEEPNLTSVNEPPRFKIADESSTAPF